MAAPDIPCQVCNEESDGSRFAGNFVDNRNDFISIASVIALFIQHFPTLVNFELLDNFHPARNYSN